MKPIQLILILLIAFSFCNLTVKAQVKASGHVRITFVDKEGDKAKTYIGKLKRGDTSNLRYELQRYNSGVSNSSSVDDTQGSLNGFVGQIAIVGEKKKSSKKRIKAAKTDLYGNYQVKNEKALKKVKEKKQKTSDGKASDKDDTGNFKKYSTSRNKKNPSQLSKSFKVTGKRIKNGNTFKKPAGNVSFIVTYKIREGNKINTYVNLVEQYLNPGSKYNLKYHGTESKRKYYLEYEPTSKKKNK